MAKHENSRGIPLPRRSALGLSGGSPNHSETRKSLLCNGTEHSGCTSIVAHRASSGELRKCCDSKEDRINGMDRRGTAAITSSGKR